MLSGDRLDLVPGVVVDPLRVPQVQGMLPAQVIPGPLFRFPFRDGVMEHERANLDTVPGETDAHPSVAYG